MLIDSVDLMRVAMPLVYPFRTAFGDFDTVESVLVRLASGELYGWGEAAPWSMPAYCAECTQTQFIIARDFIAPLLIGTDIRSGDDLQRQLSAIRGNHFAKAVFDLAWWDLYAKSLGQPLWRVAGGDDPTVDAGADFGVMDSIDALVRAIDNANHAGYKRIKLKYRPGWDLEMIRVVRTSFPNTTIHIDCNAAYTLRDLEMFEQLDRYDLAMIEQPLGHDDLIDHAALQRHVATPLCLDESITSDDKARQAIEIGACRWVNIKPGRVGGVTSALAIHDTCMHAGVPCWVGGMLESAVGASHCVALATLPNIKYPSDIFPSERFFRRDLATPPMKHSGPSQFEATDRPGVGAEPDADAMRAWTVEKTTITRDPT